MSGKDRGQQAVAALLDFGRVLSTTVAATKKSILAKIEGAGSEQSAEEVLSTNAAVLFRPAEPDDDGACEVMFLRQDDERAIITTRDARWQVTVDAGETVVRAFGADAALLRLRPNGDVVIKTTGTIYHGADSATDAAALASKVDALEAKFNGHIHITTATVGATAVAGVIAPTTNTSAEAPYASQRVKIDS